MTILVEAPVMDDCLCLGLYVMQERGVRLAIAPPAKIRLPYMATSKLASQVEDNLHRTRQHRKTWQCECILAVAIRLAPRRRVTMQENMLVGRIFWVLGKIASSSVWVMDALGGSFVMFVVYPVAGTVAPVINSSRAGCLLPPLTDSIRIVMGCPTPVI